IDCCFHVGYPPDQCCQRPEKQLEIRPCEADPESLGFLWEKPRVAHVAVQRRLQINQQEPKLVNLAAKMLARQSVSKFVKGNDHKNRQHSQGKRGDLEESVNISAQLV